MTIPPDNVATGTTGHIGIHNNIADVLTQLTNQQASVPAFSWGTANLVAGQAVVNNGLVQSSSIVFLTRMQPGGTLGVLAVPAIVPGVSFTITSSSPTETSQVGYLIKI